MVKLAETLIKSTEQLFFIPPVMLSLRLTKAIKHYFNFSGAMKHNGGGMVSWGLDTTNLSTEYKLNKLIQL